MRSVDVTQSDLAQPTGGLIGIEALAERLGVSERFVRRLVAERRVPYLKIGKYVRFDPAEIEQWVAACRVPHR